MMLRHGAAQQQHPGSVMSWSVLGTPPCCHLVSLHQGETTQRGMFLGARASGGEAKGVHAGLARVTYVLMIYFEALSTWH